jgi:hypothetical protein
MLLWKDICENKLLAKAHIVLFLNKVSSSHLCLNFSLD